MKQKRSLEKFQPSVNGRKITIYRLAEIKDDYKWFAYCDFIKVLVDYRNNNEPLPYDVRKKGHELSVGQRKQLVKKGLTEEEPDDVIPTIEILLKEFKETRISTMKEGRLKQNTIQAEKAALDYIERYFKSKTRIDFITDKQAFAFRSWLKAQVKPMNSNEKEGRDGTVNKIVKRAKQLFSWAVKRKYLKASPFSDVVGGSTANLSDLEYVRYERFKAAMDILTDSEERLVLALAYYLGIRIPSEIESLELSHIVKVDGTDGIREKIKIMVVVKKNVAGMREVPVLPELQSYLDAVRSLRTGEQEYLFVCRSKGGKNRGKLKNIGSIIRKKLRQAGMDVWDDIFKNLRSSLCTVADYVGVPEIVQDKFFGNRERTRSDHYKNRGSVEITDKDIRRMAVVTKFYGGRLAGGGWEQGTSENHSKNISFSSDPRECLVHCWGMVAESYGLNLTGEELADGFLSSDEYVQAINGFAPIFSVYGKHKEGKVSEKEVVRTVKKYLRRVGNDAADSIDGLVAHFAKIDPDGNRTRAAALKGPCPNR